VFDDMNKFFNFSALIPKKLIKHNMKAPWVIVHIGILIILLNCTTSNDNKESVPNISDEGILSDTIVYSSPKNHSATIDTMTGASKQEIRSYTDILDLFERLNYTPEAWQAGIREVPRVYLTIIGDRWSTTTSKEITVMLKKQLFFRGIAPLILYSNELIMKDRDRLKKIRAFLNNKDIIEAADRIWVLKLASLYKVTLDKNHPDGSTLDELWKRVDIVPPSLALSQGAEESGWGTSRFAATGNAIYGQWTWGSNAMIPEQQRKELGNYGIAAFETLQESVSAYMLNLNTHNAYSKLRDKRAELREKGEKITGSILAEQLTKYSERGEEYVQTLKSLMEYNRLSPADDAFLSSMPPIYLIPVSD
jgi:uncharacterized FlgJ-related protein